MRSILLLAAACLAVAPLPAQRLGEPEKRPKLVAGADTNDAGAYLLHGGRTLEGRPDEAAQAFYWAARLDPSSADALYGRRIALLMRKPTTLSSYMQGGRRARESKATLAIDSLQLRAYRLDPFLYRKYDRTMLMSFYRNLLRDGRSNAADIDEAILDYLDRSGPGTLAWLRHSEGRLPEAITQYARAIKAAKYPAGYRIQKARVHVTAGHIPPAITEFTLALADLRKEDAKKDELVVFYDSKALVEHSIGVLQEKAGQLDSAKVALGRALEEDLSYFPAHISLGLMALVAKDTATAVSELGLAAELAADEPYVHFLHGYTLMNTGDHEGAARALRKSIDLESLYAAPHFELGRALEKGGDAAGARASYTRFLELSARRDQRRVTAETRLDNLKGK